MENDLMLHDMSFHDGEIDMSLSGEDAQMFMFSLVKMCEQAGGKNFLTITVNYKNDKYSITIENCNGNDTPAEKMQRLEEELEQTKARLATYEEAEQQKRLVMLPCKVGDTVYRIDTDPDISDKDIQRTIVDSFTICDNGEVLVRYDSYDGVICTVDNLIYGTPYLDYYLCFLTQEAALNKNLNR